MTVLQPVFWPPKHNCIRCEKPYDVQEGGIKQGDYLFICRTCAPTVIPLLLDDLTRLGKPYIRPFTGVVKHRLQMIVDAGELAKGILSGREIKNYED